PTDLPPAGALPLRAGGLWHARGGPDAHRRAPGRGLARGEPPLLRGQRADAEALPARLVLHRPLRLDALLHVRLLVRAAGRARALRPLPAGRRGARPAGPRPPPR